MAESFSAQVSAIVLKHKELAEIVARESIQRLVDQAQTPKAKGGNMPVDTGFLRASGQMSYTGMPTGPTRGREREGEESGVIYPSSDVFTMLAGFSIGVTAFFGWSAAYARKQNLYNGFLDKAVNNWQKIVDATVRDVIKRL